MPFFVNPKTNERQAMRLLDAVKKRIFVVSQASAHFVPSCAEITEIIIPVVDSPVVIH